MSTKQSLENTEKEDQLVLIVQPELNISYSSGTFLASAETPVDSLNKLLKRYQANVVPMITKKNNTADQRNLPPVLSNTYFIYPEKGELNELAEELRKLDIVDAAYIKPASEEPGMEK